jgi:phosphoglucosamine mutase
VARVGAHAARAQVEHELGQDGRVLIRPSGTEPLLRVMVEARSDDVAERLAQQMADAVAV